ncbi:MAG: oligosaccharide flippase family protein [Mycobacterium sp.]
MLRIRPQALDDRAMNADRLVRNSVFLMASTAAMAALGFGFSLVVARLFSPEQVGAGTSLLSALSLIAYLSLFGLNTTIVRFYRSSENPNAQITQSIAVVATLGLAFSGIYLLLVPLYAPELSFVHENPLYAFGFLIAGAASGINLLTDFVFIGARKSEYNLFIDGLVQGLTKLILCVALVGLGAYGIFASAGAGYLVAAVVGIFCLSRVLGFRFDFGRTAAIKSQLSYSVSSYISGVLNIVPVMALPLIAVHTLGAASAGYFFLTFQIANTLYGISYAVGEAFFAEGSFDQSRFVKLLRKSGLMLVALQIPVLVILAVCGRYVLSAFGAGYAQHGQQLLQILALAGIPVALNTWAGYVLKLMGLMNSLVVSNVAYAVVTIGFAQLWGHRGVDWLGWAWLAGNAVAALCAVAAIAFHRLNRAGRNWPGLDTLSPATVQTTGSIR